ncbi:MAG: NAD+ synthase [Spirochaetia bacterium]|nr:NAD+ synthase [Spirochaetia bacterium]
MKGKTNTLRFFVAQVNLTVGDIRGNTAAVIAKIKEAEYRSADVVIFPELSITGYPPEDLLLKETFVRDNISALKEMAKSVGDIAAIAGFVDLRGGKRYNSAAVMHKGRIVAVYDKTSLPNYGVFDEKRYFEQGKKPLILDIGGARIGVTICEDLWVDSSMLECLKGKTDFLVNISASPYHLGKWKERFDMFKKRAKELGTDLIYCNLIGGQDELVFDGHSLIIGKTGKLLAQGWQFAEYDLVYDLNYKPRKKAPGKNTVKIDHSVKFRADRAVSAPYKPVSTEQEVYEALKLGTRDYLFKSGFKKAYVALSGGVDSALVAAVAADALGADNVSLVFMPTKFSSKESYDDARELADNLGIRLKVIGIQDILEMYLDKLTPEFMGLKPDTTEENLQARIRGNIMMAFSNKFNALVLTTGNKSEMSTGYATLYGDMAGGFAVIKDVPKTLVYKLCRMRNKKAGYDLIPQNILTKAPTAELRFNQKDSDSLPEYSLLDRIIYDYMENDKTYSDLKGKYEETALKKAIRLFDFSEYKRRQAPPGVKISPKAFGRDRRMPIVNKYRE